MLFRYRLRPRVLCDVSAVDMKTSILGQAVSFPVCVGATGSHRLAHTDGELATARGTCTHYEYYTKTLCSTSSIAATKLDSCMMLSVWSNSSIEDVAEASSSGLRWFQLNIFRNKEMTKTLVLRAEKAGYKAIVITVDQPVVGNRTGGKFIPPPHISFPNLIITESPLLVEDVIGMLDPSVTWKDIEWIRGLTQLPIVIKGILTAEDAREALKHGVQGIIVSNHGGRQLDGVPAAVSRTSLLSACITFCV